ncbi:hypothetical protein CR513_18187, partial [Mucuna pruriens]
MEDETSGKGSTLILGRPFLMTARTKIDVHSRTLSMEFGDTLVQFNIFFFNDEFHKTISFAHTIDFNTIQIKTDRHLDSMTRLTWHSTNSGFGFTSGLAHRDAKELVSLATTPI